MASGIATHELLRGWGLDVKMRGQVETRADPLPMDPREASEQTVRAPQSGTKINTADLLIKSLNAEAAVALNL